MTKYYVFGSTDDYLGYFLADLYQREDTYVFNTERKLSGKLGLFFYRVFFTLGRQIPCIYKVLALYNRWYLSFITENTNIEVKNDNVFIIFDVRDIAYNGAFLQMLRKKYNGKIVIIYYNPISKTRYDESFRNKYYDLICVFSSDDARKYKALKITGFYSELKDVLPDNNEKSDVFFVGSDKGRLSVLHDFYRKAKEEGVLCNFYINGVPREKQLFPEEVHYNQYISYKDVIGKIKASKCILEIIQDGVNGGTLRYREALTYQKRLISNNTNLEKGVSFDSRFMKKMTSVESFDFCFIKDTTPVQYNYSSSSPNIMLDQIKKGLEK